MLLYGQTLNKALIPENTHKKSTFGSKVLCDKFLKGMVGAERLELPTPSV